MFINSVRLCCLTQANLSPIKPGRFSLQLAAKFITNLLINLDVTHEHTIFYGASAGGYFSLACAGLFPKSKIVGDISQVDLPSSPYDYNVPLLQQFGINNFKDIFYYWDINQLPSNIYILMNKGDIVKTVI